MEREVVANDHLRCERYWQVQWQIGEMEEEIVERQKGWARNMAELTNRRAKIEQLREEKKEAETAAWTRGFIIGAMTIVIGAPIVFVILADLTGWTACQ